MLTGSKAQIEYCDADNAKSNCAYAACLFLVGSSSAIVKLLYSAEPRVEQLSLPEAGVLRPECTHGQCGESERRPRLSRAYA